MHFFLSLIAPYSIFYKSSFTLKLDFEKIELQKMGISLISLAKGAEYCIFCAKMAFTHFGHKIVLTKDWDNWRDFQESKERTMELK